MATLESEVRLLFVVLFTCNFVHCLVGNVSAEDPTLSTVADILDHSSRNREIRIQENERGLEVLMRKLVQNTIQQLNTSGQFLDFNSGVSKDCRDELSKVTLEDLGYHMREFRMLTRFAESLSSSFGPTLRRNAQHHKCTDRKEGSNEMKQYCTLQVKLQSADTEIWDTTKDAALNLYTSPNDSIGYDLYLDLGFCVPCLCTEKDIQLLLSEASRNQSIEVKVQKCHKRSIDLKMESVQIAVLVIFGVVAFFVLCGTAFDILPCRDEDQLTKQAVMNSTFRGGFHAFLLSFSLATNTRNLFDTKVQPDSLPFINGIRVLSMIWIVLINVYDLLALNSYNGQIGEFGKLPRHPFLESIVTGYVVADTFFFMGGLLLAYRSFKVMERNGTSFDVLRFYLHRVWRILPPVLVAVGFLFLIPLMGSGPNWNEVAKRQMNKCTTYWWGPVFMVNTWLKFDTTCLPQSWYMSADLHFVLLSPLAIIPLYKWPYVGVVTIFSFVAASSLSTGLRSYFYHSNSYSMFNQANAVELYRTQDLFIRPYPHFGAYCIGILVGYILVKHPKFKMNWIVQVIGWCAAIVLNIVILMKPYRWSSSEGSMSKIAALYSGLHHVGWAIGLSWLILMCASGRAGFISHFLSWKMFIPVGRLMYSVYLINHTYLWYMSHLIADKNDVSHFSLVNQLFATFSICLLMGFFYYLFFEAPLAPLEKALFPRKVINYKILSKQQTTVGHQRKSIKETNKSIMTEKV